MAGPIVTLNRPPRLVRLAVPNLIGVVTLYRRELRRFVASWPEFVIAPVLAQLLMIAAFSLALGVDAGGAEGQAALRYLAPGLIAYSAFIEAFSMPAAILIWQKYEGSLADTLAAPLSPTELLFGYVGAGASVGLAIAGLLALVALAWLGIAPAAPLLMVGFVSIAALLGAALGLLAGIALSKWDEFAAVVTFCLTPLLFFSGVFAPLDRFPEPVAGIIGALPLAELVSGFRAATLDGGGAVPVISLVTLAGLLALGWWLLARGWRLRG